MDRPLGFNYLFIGGTGRSGTNIVREMIASSTEVASLPFEHRFIIDPEGVVDFLNSYLSNWNPFYCDTKLKRFDDFLSRLSLKTNDGSSYADWELSKYFRAFDRLRTELLDSLVDYKYQGNWPGALKGRGTDEIWVGHRLDRAQLVDLLRTFVQKNIEDFIVRENAHYYVEDNTWNVLYADELVELLPGCKVLNIYRDPRDVVVSFQKQGWCPSRLSDAVKMYKGLADRIIRIDSLLSPSRFKSISMEQVLRAPEANLGAIFEWAEINVAPKLGNMDLSLGNIGRWRNELSVTDRRWLSKELTFYIKYFGYEADA